jgi:HEAT repeat protein
MTLRRGSDGTALREIVERQYPRDERGLIAQLCDPSPALRRRAARDLAAHPDAALILGERLGLETEPSVREALFTALTLHPSEAAAGILLSLLRTEDAGLRNGAIEALSAMPEAVGPQMTSLLRDPDSDVRIFTVNLLIDLRHAQVRPWLLQVLREETHVNVIAAAIEVLAEVGTAAELPALRAAHERFSDEAFIGFATEIAIERIEAA